MIIRILDCDTGGDDLFFEAPASLERDAAAAAAIVSAAVEAVQRADPVGYMYEDLEAALHEKGFHAVKLMTAEALW